MRGLCVRRRGQQGHVLPPYFLYEDAYYTNNRKYVSLTSLLSYL
jgi:hypothetical protein